MGALVSVEPKELVAVDPAQQEATVLATICQLARDPSVDVAKLEALLHMQERITGKQAEIEFNLAMARLQPRLPVIVKRGKINIEKGPVTRTQSTFATYEDIDKAIRPLLCQEGFSLSFNSEAVEKGNVYYATISHAAGHSKQASMALPADTSGSKNGIQAVGSTISYAKRYLVGMLLNIVTKDEDNDGNSFGLITEAQEMEIEDLIGECGMNAESRMKFLQLMGAPKVAEIRATEFKRAIENLNIKLRAVRSAAK